MSELGGAGADPGRGAREQAARAAARVQEAQRKLAQAQRRQAAWEAGAEGERRTAAVLAELATEGWQVLHDVHWPGRPFANIDHIIVGPAGVLVIDSKNWSGRIDVRDGVLRQNGYRRTQACDGAAQAAAAVAALLQPQHRRLVAAIVCLIDQPTPSSQPTQVQVVGLRDLAGNLRGRTAWLSIADAHSIAAHLRQTLTGQRSPVQTTTAALSNAVAAPRDPQRRSTPNRLAGAPDRDAAPARRRGTPNSKRRTDRQDAVVAGVLKLVAIFFLVFVALPAWLDGLQDRLVTPPTNGTTVPTATLSPAP
jgi:hypothetical protein